MQEKAFTSSAKVLSFQSKAKKTQKTPELKELLQDREVAEFYKFVAEYDLRVEALKMLEDRINKHE